MHIDFVMPRYDEGGFAGIPAHLVTTLTSGKYDAVVLLLVDGFGWRFFDKFQENPFLRFVTHAGTATKLTSQFPSTTAAHLTTIHSGLPVGEHGVFEWIYYDPKLEAIIAPLLFSYGGTAERDTLRKDGFKPAAFLPSNSFYHGLKKQGIPSTILQHREYTPSSYSNILFSGATARGYKTFPEALVTLSQLVAASTSPSYYFMYYEKIDAVSHEYGPQSPQTEAEIQVFLLTMEHIFLKAMSGSQKKCLFLLTADHGHCETDPQTTIYLNRNKRFEGIERFLRMDKQQKLIVPAGSARDFFLYINYGLIDEAQAFLASRLEGKAEVRKVADLVAEGFFGPVITPAFLERAGDLVILPYLGKSVWWFEKDKYEQKFRGHHGGLTKPEMEIPLIMWEMM